jgi:orotate phosphoribosyltransferase
MNALPPDDHARLAALLRAHSVRTGTFTLASGATTNVYCDVKKTSLTGEGAALIGRGLLALARAASPEAAAVGGLTLGADPLVTATSIAAFQAGDDLGAVIVRKAAKDHGTSQALEVPAGVPDRAHVVAVDDVVTTAGSTLQAIEALRAHGFTVEHAVCVVDRGAGGAARLAEHGVTLHALFELDALT